MFFAHDKRTYIDCWDIFTTVDSEIRIIAGQSVNVTEFERADLWGGCSRIKRKPVQK